jgi:hypothetical protein
MRRKKPALGLINATLVPWDSRPILAYPGIREVSPTDLSRSRCYEALVSPGHYAALWIARRCAVLETAMYYGVRVIPRCCVALERAIRYGVRVNSNCCAGPVKANCCVGRGKLGILDNMADPG